MKKLKLNSTAFAGAEVLSRTQMKNVMGGIAADCNGDTKGDCLARYINFESTGNADADAILTDIIVDTCNQCPDRRPI